MEAFKCKGCQRVSYRGPGDDGEVERTGCPFCGKAVGGMVIVLGSNDPNAVHDLLERHGRRP